MKSRPANDQKKDESASSSQDVKLDRKIQNHIGNRLKAVYDEVAAEPVPDKFLQLLAELEKKESER